MSSIHADQIQYDGYGRVGVFTAIKRDGSAFRVRANNYGPSGVVGPLRTDPSDPGTQIRDAVAVVGGDSVAILKRDGTVWTAGYTNERGELGRTDGAYYGQVQGLSNIVKIAAGGYHRLALTQNGEIWTWGFNSHGQLGDGTTENRFSPVRVLTASATGENATELNAVDDIAAHGDYSIALKKGKVLSWGSNRWYQIGHSGSSLAIEIEALQSFY